MWSDLVADETAIWTASLSAAAAYRALVGPTPARADLVIDPADGPLGPLVAILTAWAGGVRGAVDMARARRLFWVSWFGPALFLASFPDEGPIVATDHPRGREHDDALDEGAWRLAQRASTFTRTTPLAALTSPWPSDVTLLLLGSLDLLDVLPSGKAGGRVICANPPYSPR